MVYIEAMKIYFTCSTAEFNKYRDNYFAIRNFLIKEKHILTRDALLHIEERLQSGDVVLKDIKDIYKACVNAIKEADSVIIEDTVSNFSTGHQITLALQMRKPTLVLWHEKKHHQFKHMFIHGIESDMLQISEYTNKNIEEIVRRFINKYENIQEKNRFHLVLNNSERMYLDWSQFVKHKSRTKVIREALKTALDSDEEYNKYLSKHKKSI